MMLFVALLSGFVMAFVAAIPPMGPIAVLVLSRAIGGRHREGVAIAFGGALVEGLYCGLAIAGTSAVFAEFPGARTASRLLGAIVIVALGIHLLGFRPSPPPEPGQPPPAQRGVLPAFGLGISAAVANPMTIVTWSTSVAVLYSILGVSFGALEKVAFSAAAAGGIAVWFLLLVRGLRRLSHRVTLSAATKVVRGAGAAAICLGVVVAISLVRDVGWG